MKKCPYCAEEIQDDAIICRWCGRDLTQPIPPSPANVLPQPLTKKRSNSCLIAFVVLAAIALLGFLALCSGGGGSGGSGGISQPSTYSVTYEITGTRVTAVSLTWENDTGGTEQGDYKIPFRKSYEMDRGAFVYISAQIVQPTSGAGSIECRIFLDGEGAYYARASGFASIATCSGTAD